MVQTFTLTETGLSSEQFKNNLTKMVAFYHMLLFIF